MQSVVSLVAINIRAVIPVYHMTLGQNFELPTLALMTSCFYMAYCRHTDATLYGRV